MSLEEKIEALPFHLRQQVEDYIDFLISRADDENSPDFPDVSAEENSENIQQSIHSLPTDFSSYSDTNPSRRNRNVSGIILAEEKVPDSDNPDYIDFADINSRFGHTPKTEEERKEPGRLRRLLDWM